MERITEIEALNIMDDTDLAVFRDEHYYMCKWAGENDKEFETQFYLDDDGSIIVYFMDGDTIIQPRTALNSHKRPVGRPSLGVTKKVSMTLPPELWAKINEFKIDQGVSQSEAFRLILEKYFAGKYISHS
jgi:hypothetical protein